MKPSLAFDRWAPWILVILTAVIPLVFYFSVYDTFDLLKMQFVYASVLALAGLWFWQQSSQGWSLRSTGMAAPILSFLGVALLSCMTSIDHSRSLFGAYRSYVYGLLPMSAFTLLFYLTTQIKSSYLMRHVTRAALVSAAVAGLYGLMQYTGHEIFEWMPRIAGGRVWSSAGNPIYFGAICAMALPLSLSRLRLGNAVAVLLILSGLTLSLSRSAWLGSGVALGYLLIVHRHEIRSQRSKIIFGLFTIVALVWVFPQARTRLAVFAAVQESSNAGRIEGWKGGIQAWCHHPLLGTGPDTFFEGFRPYRTKKFIESIGAGVTQAHAHNEIIQIASTMGTAGLAAWLWICLAFVRRLKCQGLLNGKVPGTYSAMMASLAAIIVQNQFNPPSVATAAWTAIFAGLLVGVTPSETGMTPRGKPWPAWLRIGVLAIALPFGLWAICIPLRADVRYKEGVVQDARHNPASALESYRKAVDLRPDIEPYQASLGNAARALAYWDEAWKAAQDQVRWHPANPDDWNNLGVAAMWLTQEAHRDQMADAKAAFEKAIALDPVFIDAWANLAKWYHIAGNLDEEKRIWKMVLQLNPQHAMALQVLK